MDEAVGVDREPPVDDHRGRENPQGKLVGPRVGFAEIDGGKNQDQGEGREVAVKQLHSSPMTASLSRAARKAGSILFQILRGRYRLFKIPAVFPGIRDNDAFTFTINE